MCIFNAATVGANMAITGIFDYVMMVHRAIGSSEQELEDLRDVMSQFDDRFFYGLVVLSILIQLRLRLMKKKTLGYGPYGQPPATHHNRGNECS